MLASLKRLSLIITVFFLSACAEYDFRINNNVIYTPPTLLNKLGVADAALNNCMLQTVKDQGITEIKNFTKLACTNSGIESLAGLQRFYKIDTLILNDNNISDITLLNELSDLKVLSLANNNITNIERLSDMNYLQSVNLAGNAQLDCSTTTVLLEVVSSVTLPKHCNPATEDK